MTVGGVARMREARAPGAPQRLFAPFCSLPVRRVRGAELSSMSFSCAFDVACSCDARPQTGQ